jgi:hypothetical protein
VVTLEDGIYTHSSIYMWWQPQAINTTPAWSKSPVLTHQRHSRGTE